VISENIKKAKTIFWDFDGVIKDSVSVKSDAFEELFSPFGSDIAKKIRMHHEDNGGMSRYDKLPIYLNLAGEKNSTDLISKYEKQFSKLVTNRVINSPWVEGVLEYIKTNYKAQKFFLITATPQKEIEEILKKLEISKYFKKVIGSPTNKKDALKIILSNENINLDGSIMIGDSCSDYEAAKENDVFFVFRKTELNKKLQKKLKCQMIENFIDG
jgi:phosphoglycolate phosphatase-like HAD superfamily hydrolase